MLEFSDLTKFDFEILEYVKDNGPISEEKIISHFDSDPDVTSLRIHELSKASYNMNYPNNKGFPISISDSSYLDKAYSRYHDEDGMPQSEYTGSVSISRRGKKALQDWKQNESDRFWDIRLCGYLTLAVSVASFILAFYNTFCG
uniref:Uncharacterized protein n=1 Tax=Siphoviridae sp. ctXPh6 TaxID=2827578 RepID=A0A8S5LJT1_9CAUD|nr:MAG TPA: hypothetical protein [Siphoviridae sp. ctXPh6]DAV52598.1 MAG TPA: hypothetical protein [Caudoviricetes sp.]